MMIGQEVLQKKKKVNIPIDILRNYKIRKHHNILNSLKLDVAQINRK